MIYFTLVFMVIMGVLGYWASVEKYRKGYDKEDQITYIVFWIAWCLATIGVIHKAFF